MKAAAAIAPILHGLTLCETIEDSHQVLKPVIQKLKIAENDFITFKIPKNTTIFTH